MGAGQRFDQESGSSPHVAAESPRGFELCFVSFALGSLVDPSANRDKDGLTCFQGSGE